MEQPELFRYTLDLLERLQITYFVVGSFASMAEDVILGKLIYFEEGGSEKHLRDILRKNRQVVHRAVG